MTTLGTLSASAAATDWIKRDPVEGVDYSFAVLGDIQTITFKDAHNDSKYVETLVDWLINNREERKIEYVVGLGDTVETLISRAHGPEYNPVEWQLAAPQLARLVDAGIPTMVLRGNHDDEAGYHQYICTEPYQAQMDGFCYDAEKTATHGNSMSNCYRKIEIGNHKYLMLGLDYSAWDDADVIAWASELVESNPDYKVILSIHAYLNSNGSFYKGEIGSSSADGSVQEELNFNAQTLWGEFVSKYENMFMVLCGHAAVTDPMIRVTAGKNGNKVYKILVDSQAYEKNDPSSFVFMLNFVDGGSAIEIEYLSATKNRHFKEGNQMRLDLPEGTLPEFELPVVTEPTTEATTAEITSAETTAAPATEADTTVATTLEQAPQKSGCGGSISATVAVCCAMGTCLAAFAMRRKED